MRNLSRSKDLTCVSWPLVVCRALGGLGVCAGWCVCGCVVVVSCASFSVGLAWGSSPGRCLSVVPPLGAFAPPWPVGHSVLRFLFPPPLTLFYRVQTLRKGRCPKRWSTIVLRLHRMQGHRFTFRFRHIHALRQLMCVA